MKAGWIWETSLVPEAVEGFDTCLRPSTVLSRGCDRIADTSIGQPARAAMVQTFTPCQVQLCCCSQLCSCCCAVRLRFIKRQLLWDGVVKHLPYKHKMFSESFILPYVLYFLKWHIYFIKLNVLHTFLMLGDPNQKCFNQKSFNLIEIGIIIIHTLNFFHITVNIVKIIWIHCSIVSHSWLAIHVSITIFTWHLDWVPTRMKTISISHVKFT